MKAELIGFAILLVVVVFLAVFVLTPAQERRDDMSKFTAVCLYLEGQVQGESCIKDGKVIETMTGALK